MSRLSSSIKLGGKEVNVPVTVVDQVVNYFSPAMGAARFQSRLRMALTGGYDAADRTRRANQAGFKRESDADSNILPDLSDLRSESQKLLRNSPIAAGAVKTNVTRIVGTGMKVKPQVDRGVLSFMSEEQADQWENQARREFNLATDTVEIDAERQSTFALMQALVVIKTLEDGDVFVNLPRFSRPGSPYKQKLQLIEAARVCNKDNQPDTNRLAGGIQKDQYGAPEKLHVLNHHPWNYRAYRRDGAKWQALEFFSKRTGSPLVLQLFDKMRPGQTRGVPYLAPVIELIKQLGRYTDAEVMAAVVNGMLTVFVTSGMNSPAMGDNLTETTTGDSTDESGMELGYGSVLGLANGEEVKVVDPTRPNTAFDPFVTAVLRQIGVGLELPFELLVKHFTASYSAAQAALLEAQYYFYRRRHWLASRFCQPVYEAVISEAIAAGRLAAPGFFTDPIIRRAWLGTRWTGDAFRHIDPMKEINAANGRINARLTTHEEESVALNGSDWEAKIPQMAKEQKLLTDNGLHQGNGTPVETEEESKNETD